MNTERIDQIKTDLAGLGTKAGDVYTNQEIIGRLMELQAALARGVFEKTHAENLRDKDILIHFEALTKEYDLDQTDVFLRFKKNMRDLGFTIGSLIKGMNGERNVRRALKLLSYDKSVRILYNVQLEDTDAEAEYDAIVIAPYGLFVVEAKNWNTSVVITPDGLLERNDDSGIVYDLVGRMSVKQALLKEYIGDDFPKNYQNILVFSNEKVKVDDQYGKIPFVCGGGISCKIREFNTRNNFLTVEQITNIEQVIIAHHKVQKTASLVNCDEIIEDYAVLMACIEDASMGRKVDLQASETKSETIQPEFIPRTASTRKWIERINWRKVGGYVINTAPAVALAIGLIPFRKR